jgi:hypothetical protein
MLIGQGGDTSVDLVEAGPGNDTVRSRDVPAAKDIVECGSGTTDTVYADKADVVSDDCEKVKAWSHQARPAGGRRREGGPGHAAPVLPRLVAVPGPAVAQDILPGHPISSGPA